MKRALSATGDCLPLERLSEALTTPERDHLAACARCQTELDLWRELEHAQPAPDEGAAVRWIVAELERRSKSPSRVPRWSSLSWLSEAATRWAAACAMVAVVAIVGYLAWDREPALSPLTTGEQTYRSGQVQPLAPIGDVPTAPTVLEWVATDGALGYDVEVSEVDGTPLWRAAASTPRVDIPPSIVSQLKPGKTVQWRVRARGPSNTVIADSGTQRFRVEINGRSPKS